MKARHVIAAFDFDGTITKKDTLRDIIVTSFGFGRFCLGLVRLSPVLSKFCLGLVGNDSAKERLFRTFFGGLSYDAFESMCRGYSLRRIDMIVRQEASEKIVWHRKAGHELVIVSASVDNWVKPWAEKEGFSRVIATVPEVRDGYVTGKFASSNCFGREKVRRFLYEYPHRADYILYFYGDSYGDLELLKVSDYAYYRRFD